MDDQEVAGRAVSHRLLERAIASVPGVIAAEVSLSEEGDRPRLRTRISASEDADAVSEAIAATLRERFGIDVDAQEIRRRPIQPQIEGPLAQPVEEAPAPREREPLGAVPEPGTVRRRAVIRHLATRPGARREVRVIASLEHAGRHAEGEATGGSSGSEVLRAVAEATLAALRVLTGPVLHVGIDRVSVQAGADPQLATVVLTLVSDRGREVLSGSAVVRDDTQRAVMRATLDALNRRVGGLLETA